MYTDCAGLADLGRRVGGVLVNLFDDVVLALALHGRPDIQGSLEVWSESWPCAERLTA